MISRSWKLNKPRKPLFDTPLPLQKERLARFSGAFVDVIVFCRPVSEFGQNRSRPGVVFFAAGGKPGQTRNLSHVGDPLRYQCRSKTLVAIRVEEFDAQVSKPAFVEFPAELAMGQRADPFAFVRNAKLVVVANSVRLSDSAPHLFLHFFRTEVPHVVRHVLADLIHGDSPLFPTGKDVVYLDRIADLAGVFRCEAMEGEASAQSDAAGIHRMALKESRIL